MALMSKTPDWQLHCMRRNRAQHATMNVTALHHTIALFVGDAISCGVGATRLARLALQARLQPAKVGIECCVAQSLACVPVCTMCPRSSSGRICPAMSLSGSPACLTEEQMI